MAKGVVKDGRVFMRDAQGDRFSVPVGDAGKELATGARYEAPDEYQHAETSKQRGTLGQQALTAGEGALETSTLGLGTAAATAIGGDEYRQAAEERARENPTARTIGQVGGALAPALLSGGESLVGSVARNTPAGLLARGSAALEGGVGRALAGAGIGGEGAGLLGTVANRAASLGASGAAEGAAYGLGSSLADSALENTDWTADRALAAMGNGAVFGLGAGAALGGAGALASAAGRKAMDAMLGEGKTLRQAVDDVITRQTIKGAGADAQAIKQITRDGSAVERLQEVGQKLVQRGIPADVEQAAPMLKAWQRESGEQLGAIAKGLDEAGVTIPVDPVRAQVDDLIAGYRSKNLKSFDAIADTLQAEVKPFFDAQAARAGVMRRGLDGAEESAAAPLSFSDMWKTRTDLRKAWQLEARAGGVTTDAKRELYDVFSQALDDGIASSANPEVATAWKAAAQDYADASALVGSSGRTARRKATAAALTGGDLGAGATAGGLLGLMTGAATGSIGLGALTQMVTSTIGSAAAKFVRARGPEILTKLAGMAAHTEEGMQSVAQALAGKGVGRTTTRGVIAPHALPAREPKPEDFDTISAHLMQAQNDPTFVPNLIAKTVEPFAREQPEVAMAMGKRIAGDIAWMQSKVPTPISRVDSSLTPLREKPQYTSQQKKQLVNYAHGLAAPMGVFQSLAPGGHVNWDGLEAVKERRPDLYQAMRDHVIKATATAEQPLSLRRRTLLGVAFDFKSDWSLANVAAIQAAGQQPPDIGNGKPAMKSVDTSANDLPGQPGFEERGAA